MEIALYGGHHSLPFWHNPQQPKEMFEPRRHKKRKLFFAGTPQIACESMLWPILMGMYAIELPLVMGHISAFCRHRGKWHFPKRIWVQITTLPPGRNAHGIPIVVHDGEVMVKHLWGGDNKTYTPYQFLGQKAVAGEETALFWQHFFEQKLIEAQDTA